MPLFYTGKSACKLTLFSSKMKQCKKDILFNKRKLIKINHYSIQIIQITHLKSCQLFKNVCSWINCTCFKLYTVNSIFAVRNNTELKLLNVQTFLVLTLIRFYLKTRIVRENLNYFFLKSSERITRVHENKNSTETTVTNCWVLGNKITELLCRNIIVSRVYSKT